MSLIWQMEVSTREGFDMKNFRHRDILAHGYIGTVAQVPKCLCRYVNIALQGAQISMCRNVQVPKYPCAEMLMCRKFLVPKIPRAENSQCRNVPVLKSPSAGTSAAPNGASAEMFPWWNIRAEMTLAEMFCAEMVTKGGFLSESANRFSYLPKNIPNFYLELSWIWNLKMYHYELWQNGYISDSSISK